MNVLDALREAIMAHGLDLLLGTTLVLACGLLLARAQKTAAARRRLGIWTALATTAYLVFAAVPLPRLMLVPTKATTTSVTEPHTCARPVDHSQALPVDATRDERLAAMAMSPVSATSATSAGSAAMSTPAATPAATPPTELTAPQDSPAVTSLTATPALGSSELGWTRTLATAYLGCAALLLLHQLLGLWRLRRILNRSRPAATSVRAMASLPHRVRVVVAGSPVRPFCTGWLRPIVVLSPALAATAKRDACAAVLRHEAAHLRVRDPLVQTLFALLALPLALHPLFWWLRRDVRFHSEVLADETAAGTSRTAYARELLNLCDDSSPSVTAVGTVAIFQRPSVFYRRIQMLLQPQNASPRPLSRCRRATQAAAMLTLVAATAATFGVPAVAQNPRQSAIRAESEALRAEIDAMRAQLAELRTELARRANVAPPQPGRPVGIVLPTGTPPAAPNDVPAPTSIAGVAVIRDAPVDPTIPPLAVLNDVLAPASATGVAVIHDVPNPPPVAPPVWPAHALDPHPAEGVPVLRDIPIVGRLFERQTHSVAIPTTPGSPSVTARTPATPGSLPIAPHRSHAMVPGMFGGTTEATVALTTRLLDLDTEVEIAQTNLVEVQQRANNKLVSKSDVRRELAQLRNLERKRKIVRGLVDGEIDATKAEMKWLKQEISRAGRQDKLRLQMQMMRTEGRYQALRAAR